MRQAAIHFDDIHNHTHHYSTQNGMTPFAAVKRYQYPLQTMNESFTLPNEPLPLESGEIHLIRFIRSNLKFNVFGLSFSLPEKAQYEYIKGVIIVEEKRLMLYKDIEYLTEYPFPLM